MIIEMETIIDRTHTKFSV